MLLETMKWTEVAELEPARLVTLIPLGSFEQHGPHLPLTVDTEIITALARAAEHRLPDRVLLTPTLWLGHSTHHLRFAGTLSVAPRLYADLVKAVVHSLVQHGARKVFLLNGHGGNEVPVQLALRELKAELAARPEVLVTAASYWRLGRQIIAEVRESGLGGVGHACEMETSIMLALRPEAVDMPAARKGGPGNALRYRVIDAQASNPVEMASDFDELSETGVLGRPELATAEKGRRLLEGIVQAIVEFLEDFLSWTPEMVAPGRYSRTHGPVGHSGQVRQPAAVSVTRGRGAGVGAHQVVRLRRGAQPGGGDCSLGRRAGLPLHEGESGLGSGTRPRARPRGPRRGGPGRASRG